MWFFFDPANPPTPMREKITYEHITWWVGIFLGESFAIIQRQAHKGRGIELQFFTLLLSVFFFNSKCICQKKTVVFPKKRTCPKNPKNPFKNSGFLLRTVEKNTPWWLIHWRVQNGGVLGVETPTFHRWQRWTGEVFFPLLFFFGWREMSITEGMWMKSCVFFGGGVLDLVQWLTNHGLETTYFGNFCSPTKNP